MHTLSGDHGRLETFLHGKAGDYDGFGCGVDKGKEEDN